MENCKDWEKFVGNEIPSSLQIQPILYKFIKKDHKIIDIGCGFGKTVFDLYDKGYFNIYGVDINKSGIKFANLKNEQLKLVTKPRFKITNAFHLPYQDSMFDCVITQAFWTTIINIKERLKFIKKINRILKKNKVLYIADFEQNYHLPLYKKRYQDGIKKGYENGTFEVINKKTGEIEYLAHHYTKKELYKLVNENGFLIEYYESKIVTSRTGNKINECVMIARKNILT